MVLQYLPMLKQCYAVCSQNRNFATSNSAFWNCKCNKRNELER